MAEIVNLRMAKKRRKREDDAVLAAENRRRHGPTLAERASDEYETKARESRLEAHRRPTDEAE